MIPALQTTITSGFWSSTLRGQLALDSNNARAALAALQKAAPYELGLPADGSFTIAMYPAYVRGESYLAANQGGGAAIEFQKIIAQRGIVVNEPIGALAHLGHARAYMLQRDALKAGPRIRTFWRSGKMLIPTFPS